MLKIRSLIVASTGAVVALGYVSAAVAQVSTPPAVPTDAQPFPETTQTPSRPQLVEQTAAPNGTRTPLESAPDRALTSPTPPTPIDAPTTTVAENAIKAAKTLLPITESVASTPIAESVTTASQTVAIQAVETVETVETAAEAATLPNVLELETAEPTAGSEALPTSPVFTAPAIADVDTDRVTTTKQPEPVAARSLESPSAEVVNGEIALTKPAKTPALPEVETLSVVEVPIAASETPDAAIAPEPSIVQTFQLVESTPALPLTEQPAKRSKPTTTVSTVIAPLDQQINVDTFDSVSANDAELAEASEASEPIPEAVVPETVSEVVAITAESEVEIPIAVVEMPEAAVIPEETAIVPAKITPPDSLTPAEPETLVLPRPTLVVADEPESETASLEDTSPELDDASNELLIQGEPSVDPDNTEPITIEPITIEQPPQNSNQAADLQRFDPGETQPVPPPDFLNPSGNPLLFPTEPDEVAIDITQPITLEQAIALARRNNQDIQRARLTLNRAYETLKEAQAGRLPTVDATASLSRTNSASTEISQRRAGALNNALGTDATTDAFNAELRVSYDIFDGGQRNAQIRAAERSVRSSQLEIEELTEDIHLATAQAYYALQQADSQVEIEAAAVEQASRTLRDATLLKRAGLGTRFDEIRANVELANNNQALTQARAEQSIARRELVTVLSLGQQVEVTTADKIAPVGTWALSLEETITLAYRNRAELEQRLLDREIQEEERRIARASSRPQVSAFATYDVLEILDDDFNGSSGYSVGVQAQWNIFDGGASRARKRQEELDLELAEVAFEQERNQIRLEVEDAYYNFEANEQNITTADEAVTLAKESLRLARLRFGAGVGTQTDVIDAQTELTRARGNLLNAIVTYNNSIASLQRAVSNDPDRRLFDLP